MKIKVCGLRDINNIKAVAALNPDYMGFICYEKSPRFIGELTVNNFTELTPLKAGVFVNESFDKIVDKINEYNLDVVQLHGDEGAWMCDALKNKKTIIVTRGTDVTQNGREIKKLSTEISRTVRLEKDITVIKAFGIDESFDFSLLNVYEDKVDYFLFDTKTTAYGGSGKTFDWNILDNYKLNVRFFLSGGISLDNLERIKEIKHPAFYGVDLNSKFEIEPGLKDIQKLQQAFTILTS